MITYDLDDVYLYTMYKLSELLFMYFIHVIKKFKKNKSFWKI